MKVGWIGLGKLGMPCAATAALMGHKVLGYDINSDVMNYEPRKYVEGGIGKYKSLDEILEKLHGDTFMSDDRGQLLFAQTPQQVCEWAEIIFIAVQTPHEPEYEGVTPMVSAQYEPKDFDYSYLHAACESIAPHAHGKVVCIISTCLPGTIRRIAEDILLDSYVAYTPSFIAMGQTASDYIDPEYVLIGAEDSGEPWPTELYSVIQYFSDLCRKQKPMLNHRVMSYESAELTKMLYNTAIASKVAISNTAQMLCDNISGADIRDVSDALKSAHRRVASPAYLGPGMGDGGGCHPRDNIAMDYLWQQQCFPYSEEEKSIFESVMLVRDMYARILAYEAMEASMDDLPVVVYGTAYKANVGIETGSHAILAAKYLDLFGVDCSLSDPIVQRALDIEGNKEVRRDYSLGGNPHVVLIGCNHDHIADITWPDGSVIIDPFGIKPTNPGDVRWIRIGGDD